LVVSDLDKILREGEEVKIQRRLKGGAMSKARERERERETRKGDP